MVLISPGAGTEIMFLNAGILRLQGGEPSLISINVDTPVLLQKGLNSPFL